MSDDLNSLENQADHHRTHAHTALSGLLSALAPDKLGSQAVERASNMTDDVAKAALHQVKSNPAGLALVGLGVAFIALNRPKPTEEEKYGTEQERIERADSTIKARARATAPTSPQSASKMRKMLDTGLDSLSPQARERVIKARLLAIDAQEQVEREARKLAAQAKDAHQSQPFVTALAVAGIGALIGGLLPSTRTEGAMLGAKRDQMMRSAEAVLRSEVAALEARGKAAVAAAAEAGQEGLMSNTASA